MTGIMNSLIRAYLLALGEFGLDDVGILEANYTYGYICWLIFLLATLINFIIMCNLLISIFSHSVTRPMILTSGNGWFLGMSLR